MELLTKSVPELIYSVSINPRLFILLLYYYLYLIFISILMLYHTAFYEAIHRPYILESFIIDIFVLSFYHLSIYPGPFFFPFKKIQNQIFLWKIAVVTTI